MPLRRLRTGIGIALIAPLLLLLGAVGTVWFAERDTVEAAQQRVRADKRVAALALVDARLLSEARRNERDFLLKLREFGFDEANARYITLLRTQLSALREDLGQMRHVDGADMVANDTRAIEKLIDAYETGVLHVVGMYRDLGHLDSGLEGNFRGSAHQLEDELRAGQPDRLMVGLLSLRRSEKNYLLRHTDSTVRSFDYVRRQLEADLVRLVPDAKKRAEFQALLARYNADFTHYVTVMREIEEATYAYQLTVHQVEPMLQQLGTAADADAAIATADADTAQRNGRVMMILAGMLALVVGLLVSAFVLRRVRGSVTAGIDFAERVAEGDLSARLQPREQAEFGVLATALNSMAEALETAYQHDRKQAEALRRANRTLRVLSQCGYELTHAADETALLRAIPERIAETGGYALAGVAYVEHDAEKRMTIVAAAGPAVGAFEGLSLSWNENDADGTGPTGAAVRTGEACVVRDIPTAPELGSWREQAARHALRSCVALPLRDKDGVFGALMMHSCEVDAFDGDEVALLSELARDLALAIVARREAAALEQVRAQLAYQSNFDALTGLANRNLFRDRIDQAIAARGTQPLAVLQLSIERVRSIHESLGQEAADALVREIALRTSALLHPGDSAARLEPDLLGIVLCDVDEADLASRARELLALVMAPLPLAGAEYHPTASLGISVHPRDGAEATTHLRNSAAALVLARARGAGTFQFHATDANERAQVRFALETDLHGAIDRREFVVHYQPKVDLASGGVCGAEALLRWQHPVRGLLLPSQFIDLAEETGLIEPLGTWVVDEVCRQLRAWRGESLPACPIAVNLSPRQFRKDGLVESVAESLRTHGVDPALLELELTESAVMHNIEAGVDILTALRELGVRCSLDDFGTGHSSLSYVRRFPIDRLKIDQSFVRDVVSEPDSAAICGAVIGLAHNLNLKVVAEGVETEAQASYLRRRGCDEMQGRYFSGPLPADEFARLIAKREGLQLPASDGPKRTLLIVDDEANIRSALRRLLRNEGYEVLLAASAREGLELLARHEVQVILSDQRMPEMNGTEFLARVSNLYPDTIRIVLSGYTDLETVIQSINRGTVFRFLTKPWDEARLLEHLREAFRFQEAGRRLAAA